MRIRDIIIVAVAVVCSIICWSQEGSLNFQRGFKIPIADNSLAAIVLPKPIVVDPDGSGSRVLLACVDMENLGLYRTQYARRRIEDVFVPISPLSTLSVDSAIVAIGAGYTAGISGKMIAAVVTEGYDLIAVNMSNGYLQRLWQVPILPAPHRRGASYASISIVPQRIWTEDGGTIAVAVGVRDFSDAEMVVFAAFDQRTGACRWRYFSDGGNEMDDVVREADAKPRDDLLIGADEPVLPIGEKKKDADRETMFHGRTYVQPWTTFRESVMSAMPHRFAHNWDAQLHPHIIYRSKSGMKALVGSQKSGKRATLRRDDRVVHMGTDDYGLLGEKMNSWLRDAKKAARLSPSPAKKPSNRTANVFIFHGKMGVEVVHMYTGNTVASIGPLRADGTTYHDINDDLVLEAVSAQIGPRSAVHSRHGVDLLYDCLGMIDAGAPTAAVELFNATVCDTEGFFGNLDLIHHFIDGDIRGEEAPHAVNTLELLGSRNVVSPATKATPPLVVQVQKSRGGDWYEVERYAVFMINTGLVTCVDPSRRRVLWRAQTGSRFGPGQGAGAGDAAGFQPDINRGVMVGRPFPHLVPYSLTRRSRDTDVTFVGGGQESFRRADTYVLAVGDTELTILTTRNGKVSRTVPLTETPVAPVLVVDFNGDGINDLIIVSRYHIYGFVGNSQASAETVSVLMLLLVGMLGILFAIREKNIADGAEEDYALPVHTGDKVQRVKTFKRSTD